MTNSPNNWPGSRGQVWDHNETAQRLHIKPNDVLRLAHSGRLPYMRLRGAIIFYSPEVEEWAATEDGKVALAKARQLTP